MGASSNSWVTLSKSCGEWPFWDLVRKLPSRGSQVVQSSWVILPMKDDASSDDARNRYLNGPVPLSWLKAAARLPGRSLHVGLVLWYAARLSGSADVHLSNTLCLRFGLDRNAKYRALRALGDARLVTVRNTRG